MIKNGQDVIRMKILKARRKEIESLQDKITGKIVIENGELHIYSTIWSYQLSYNSNGK